MAPVASGRTGGLDQIGSFLTGDGFRRVQLQVAGSNLSFRVKINGRPASLVVDTGAPYTVLDRNQISSYQLRSKETLLGLNSPAGHSNDGVGFGNVTRIQVADIFLANDLVPIIDLSAMNRESPIHAAGVLGMTHMRKLGAIIYCKQRVLYLNPFGGSPSFKAKLTKVMGDRNFVAIPMRLNNAGISEVDCQVNGYAAPIVVETAAFTTIVTRKLAQRAAITLVDTGFTVEGVGHLKAPLSSGVAAFFSVGAFSTRNQKLQAEPGVFNVLGIDYLRDHDAVIDCGSMTLFLHH